jgi:hypothetical protein
MGSTPTLGAASLLVSFGAWPGTRFSTMFFLALLTGPCKFGQTRGVVSACLKVIRPPSLAWLGAQIDAELSLSRVLMIRHYGFGRSKRDVAFVFSKVTLMRFSVLHGVPINAAPFQVLTTRLSASGRYGPDAACAYLRVTLHVSLARRGARMGVKSFPVRWITRSGFGIWRQGAVSAYWKATLAASIAWR